MIKVTLWERYSSHVKIFNFWGGQDEAENVVIHLNSSYDYKQQGLWIDWIFLRPVICNSFAWASLFISIPSALESKLKSWLCSMFSTISSASTLVASTLFSCDSTESCFTGCLQKYIVHLEAIQKICFPSARYGFQGKGTCRAFLMVHL